MPDDVLTQFDSPDDKHWVARNMQRREINKYIEKKCDKLVIDKNQANMGSAPSIGMARTLKC